MKAKILNLFIMASLISANTFAQCDGWNWPEDEKMEAKAKEKQVLYSDYLKMGNYKASVQHLNWLLKETPTLNKSIYINGAKIYEELAETEKNKDREKALEDSALLLYDLRIQYCNEEADVLNRKAFSAYKYWKDRPAKYEELFNLLEKAYEMNQLDFWINNVVAYMDAARRYKKMSGNIPDEKVLSVYESLQGVIDAYESKNPDFANKVREQVDKLLVATLDNVDCEFIQDNLGEKLKNKPEDLSLAKNILKLSLAFKCTDKQAFLDAAKNVFEVEPEFGLGKLIGIKMMAEDNYDEAMKYFEKAIELTEENIKQADIYMSMADLKYKQGNKSAARGYARNALQADPGRAEAYNLIGNLYYGSYSQCKGGQDPVKDRAVFLAAYEMYRLAGNSDGMGKAQSQFPSIDEIFTYNYEEGQSINVGCWVGENVTIRRRPN